MEKPVHTGNIDSIVILYLSEMVP